MGHARIYIPGDRLVTCDVCGLRYRFSRMRRGVTGNQKGLVVCPYDFDETHPNEAHVPFRQEGKVEEVR